eukprot:SAG11_NODE_1138_length_5724_cov_188.276978_2_plen_70_part_00
MIAQLLAKLGDGRFGSKLLHFLGLIVRTPRLHLFLARLPRMYIVPTPTTPSDDKSDKDVTAAPGERCSC